MERKQSKRSVPKQQTSELENQITVLFESNQTINTTSKSIVAKDSNVKQAGYRGPAKHTRSSLRDAVNPSLTTNYNRHASVNNSYSTAQRRSPSRGCIENFCIHQLGCQCLSKVGDVDNQPSHSNAGQGVWPSNLHSLCVKLVVNMGTAEYILAPRLAWHYGGVPYYIVVFLLVCVASFPVHFLECLVGQYAGRSLAVFLPQLGPIFRALGYAILLVSMFVIAYYMSQITWIILYAYHATQFTSTWTICSPDYNSKYCYSNHQQDACFAELNNSVYFNFTCFSASEYCRYHGYSEANDTHCLRLPAANQTAPRWMVDYEEPLLNLTADDVARVQQVGPREPSEADFFRHYVRGTPLSECDKNPLVCHNHERDFAIGYIVCWLLALLPCTNLWLASSLSLLAVISSPVVTTLVIIRVLLFDGALAGAAQFFYARADLTHLLRPSLWSDAVLMTYWSVSIGLGVTPTLASRDRHRHPTLLGSTIVVGANVATGLLNSVLLFAVRGHLERDDLERWQLGRLETDSEALVFVALATIVHKMPRPQLWGVLYFGMMALQTLAAVSMILVTYGLNLVDAEPLFSRMPFAAAVVIAVSPALLLAALIVGSHLGEVHWLIFSVLRLQWTGTTALFVTMVGWKLSSSHVKSQIRDKLGAEFPHWRLFVVSWVVVTPFVLTLDFLQKVSDLRMPPLDADSLPAALLGFSAAALPPVVALCAVISVCRSTQFVRLWSTSEEFGRVLEPRCPASGRVRQRRSAVNDPSSRSVSGATSRASGASSHNQGRGPSVSGATSSSRTSRASSHNQERPEKKISASRASRTSTHNQERAERRRRSPSKTSHRSPSSTRTNRDVP